MRVKAGVRLLGLKPEVWAIILAATPIWVSYGVPAVTITSAIDGIHKRASEHYAGLALDLRIHELKGLGVDVAKVARQLQEALGEDFDVIHESVGLPNEHLHCQYNPKAPLGAP